MHRTAFSLSVCIDKLPVIIIKPDCFVSLCPSNHIIVSYLANLRVKNNKPHHRKHQEANDYSRIIPPDLYLIDFLYVTQRSVSKTHFASLNIQRLHQILSEVWLCEDNRAQLTLTDKARHCNHFNQLLKCIYMHRHTASIRSSSTIRNVAQNIPLCQSCHCNTDEQIKTSRFSFLTQRSITSQRLHKM